ncbi:LAME_0D08284g1_1 [Lachancea meyersii CBS 8951]|uniref:LAME_0D08284g1_1 n=1 Tax=Lachancea meyersii CBS 8951 TaxID=1266667 RepID=A0A1G4JAZ1_9SACH|nr:LAME_0D08284g1_1 [Lachancea meyersii CBS 8951]
MSEPKPKRNSFFFFSNKSNAPKNEPKASNVKYIGKYPLMPSTSTLAGSASSEGKARSVGTSNLPGMSQPLQSTVKDSNTVITSNVSKLSRIRPPPPQVNLAELPVEKPETEKSDSEKEEHPQSDGNSAQFGHERKKSEIDELMDHIEHFGNESRHDLEDNISLESSSPYEYFETPSLNLPAEDADQERQSIHVKSLNLSDSKRSLNSAEVKSSKDNSIESKSNLMYEGVFLDEDRFSFAASQVDPVQNLQQISFNNERDYEPESSRGSHQQGHHSRNVSSSDQGAPDGRSFDLEASNNNSLYGDDQSYFDKPRQFRVVNEHRPNFTLNDGSSTTTDNESFVFAPADAALRVHDADIVHPPVISSLPPIASSSLPYDQELEDEQTSSSSPAPVLKDLSPISGPESDFTIQAQYPEAQDTAKSHSPHRSGTDKSVKLVSSYVEELRLKYFPTSNSLQPPPNLPFVLKTKNSLEQPQNIKVRIRTSSKQIGIKHGKAKQKLLSLETAKEEDEEASTGVKPRGKNSSISTEVDHTREFHDLLNKSASGINLLAGGNLDDSGGHENDYNEKSDDLYLQNIPGDEAYDSDDVMAPLRERSDQNVGLRFVAGFDEGSNQTGSTKGRVGRSDTVTSYFTRKNNNRARSGTLDADYHYKASRTEYDCSFKDQKSAEDSSDDEISVQTSNSAYLQSTFNGGLRVTNQDPVSD